MVIRLRQHHKTQVPDSWWDPRIFRDYWILHLNDGDRRRGESESIG